METSKVQPLPCILDIEPIPERTRFSMLTAERGESSIHDFINDELESMPAARATSEARDRDIVVIKAQLDNILEHVNSTHSLLTA